MKEEFNKDLQKNGFAKVDVDQIQEEGIYSLDKFVALERLNAIKQEKLKIRDKEIIQEKRVRSMKDTIAKK